MNSDNMWLTVMGLIIIISIVGLLIAKKINPVVGMTIIPCLGAMILGYSVTDLVGFFAKGYGASPKLTKSIMAELEALYPPSYSSYIDFLYTCRQKIKVLDITYNEKQQLLSQIVSQEYLNHDKQAQFLAWLDVR